MTLIIQTIYNRTNRIIHTLIKMGRDVLLEVVIDAQLETKQLLTLDRQ